VQIYVKKKPLVGVRTICTLGLTVVAHQWAIVGISTEQKVLMIAKHLSAQGGSDG
jgi:hypothetical protein